MNERKIEEIKMKKSGRLPPGQALTRKFPVEHLGPIPEFNPSTWTFLVWGEVEKTIQWTWDFFLHQPRVTRTMDLHCVTRWSRFDTVWEGFSLKRLIDEGFIKPLPSAKYIIQHAAHGYTTNLPLEVYLQDNFLLATHFKGKPLTPEHGYPLRGIIGHIQHRTDLKEVYLWKGAKWLRGLEFTSYPQRGYWEQHGYHNEGDVCKEERRPVK